MRPLAPILLIEDDPALRESVGEILEERGFVVRTAESGEAALRDLRRGARPCLILLDLMMPKMTGWDFLNRARTDPRLDGIPVVVLSGHLLGPARDSALKATGFVRKPIRPEELVAEVEKFCKSEEEPGEA